MKKMLHIALRFAAARLCGAPCIRAADVNGHDLTSTRWAGAAVNQSEPLALCPLVRKGQERSGKVKRHEKTIKDPQIKEKTSLYCSHVLPLLSISKHP